MARWTIVRHVLSHVVVCVTVIWWEMRHDDFVPNVERDQPRPNAKKGDVAHVAPTVALPIELAGRAHLGLSCCFLPALAYFFKDDVDQNRRLQVACRVKPQVKEGHSE
jgi:hypothetical protein